MSQINNDNYRLFAYTNEEFLKTAPKGMCVEFFGLNLTSPQSEPKERAEKFGERGMIILRPFTNPWSWLNPQALDITERVIEIICEKYSGIRDNICTAGGSMGGYEALMFTVKTKYRLRSCTVNCPICDTERFNRDDKWRGKTFELAFYEEGDFEKSLHDHSPINNIEKMPDIPYRVFQCRGDTIVKKETQSDVFVEKAKDFLDIRYFISDTSEHCVLSEELAKMYDDFIVDSLVNE